jgi:hypothetical protein
MPQIDDQRVTYFIFFIFFSRDNFTPAELALGFGKSNDVEEREQLLPGLEFNMVTCRRSSNDKSLHPT